MNSLNIEIRLIGFTEKTSLIKNHILILCLLWNARKVHFEANRKRLRDFKQHFYSLIPALYVYILFYTKYLFSLWLRNVCFEIRF